MSKYLIVVENTKTNFSAYSPDVPGCTATGNTIEEAVKQMKAVMLEHFDGMEHLPHPKGLNHYMNDESFKKGSTDYILLVDFDEGF